MRPALGAPALDGHLVAFPGPTLRLLATPSFPAEDLPDVGGVVADAKGAGDDFGDSGQRPQIGTEPVRPSPPQEGLQQLGALSRCDPRRPPRRWLGPQGIGATRPDFGLPPTHGRRRTADLSRDLAHPKPILEEGDGPPPPRFQLCGTALGSHASEITIVPFVMQASIVALEAPAPEVGLQGPKGALLTIAIPTHNRARFLSLCLGQIAKQLPGNERDVELIVSDNCSTDDTKDVVRSFVERRIQIRYLLNSEDLGADRNFARCYEAATGKYVVIFADDDVLLDGALERVLGVLRGGQYGVIHLNGYGYSDNYEKEQPLQEGSGYEIYDDAAAFIKKIHFAMTFSSGNIFNKSLTPDIDPFEFVGTSLVHLGWILRAIVRAKTNGYIEEFVVAAKTHNTGGYQLCKVFGENINRIFDALARGGMDRGYFRTVNSHLVSMFLPSYVLKARRGEVGYSFAREDYFDSLYPIFRKYLSFWLVMVPVISLPVSLAALWFRLAWHAQRMSERLRGSPVAKLARLGARREARPKGYRVVL